MPGGNQPPRVLARLLALRLSGTEVGRTVLGDFHEEFAERVVSDPRAARRWFRREALSVLCRRSAVAERTFTRQLPPPGDAFMSRLFTDLRNAARSLAHQPRFTVIASLTLALGIGGATAIFSVANGILLQPLPYPDGDRVVNVWSHAPKIGYNQFPLSPDLYFLYERDNQVFEHMALLQRGRANLTGSGSPDVVDTIETTHTYFSTLGIAPVQGRVFTAAEDAPGGPNVVVLSHRAWRDRFGADTAIVGRTIQMDGAATEVIGVLPAAIDGSGTPDFFLPARHDRAAPIQGSFGWNAIARLRPGVTPEAATTNLVPLVVRLTESITVPPYRAFLLDNGYAPLVHRMKDDVIGDSRQPLLILLGTVGILLLIACANVANLFLVRAEGRQLEIAIRVAMGAARWTLVRSMLAEALLIATLGAVLGVAAVAAGLPALLRLAPPTVPRLHLVTVDVTVLAFAAALAVVSACLFGLLPALKYTRPRSLAALRLGVRGGDDPARQRARHGLVVLQTAMALVLLVGSGLLVRSFNRLLATDPGIQADGVMTFRVALPASQYPDGAPVRAFSDRLLARLNETAGVASAGAATVLPIANAAPGTAHVFEDRQLDAAALPPIVHYKLVAGDYFGSMGIPLLRGRLFHSGDLAEDVYTAVVNQAIVDQYFPGGDGLGKRVRMGGQSGPDGQPAPWITIVGVVGNERQDGLRLPIRPLIYYARPGVAPVGLRTLDYVVKGRAGEVSADVLRRAVWDVDAGLPVASVRSMQEILDASVVEFTFTMATIGIAAALALVLGAVGLYGVLSYAVLMRTREIGVRMALGAQPSLVMRSVVGQGAVLASIGLVIGIAAAAALTRVMDDLLFETAALDPLTFIAMSAALLAVALLAAYLPARRAAHVSPMESMRS